MSEELTAPQELALLAVMQGESYTGAAVRAKVSRETVSRWMNRDTPVSRERRRRTDALWAEYENQILRLLGQAIGAHEWLLRNADYLGAHYDPKAHLGAVALAYRVCGLDPGRAAPLVNLTVAQQNNGASTGGADAGSGPPIREVIDQ